jgi:hypothetical protein
MSVAPGFGDDRADEQHTAVETMYNAAVRTGTLAVACAGIVAAAGGPAGPGYLLTRLRQAFPDLPTSRDGRT